MRRKSDNPEFDLDEVEEKNIHINRNLFPFIPFRLLKTMGIDWRETPDHESIIGKKQDIEMAYLCGGVEQGRDATREGRYEGLFESINQVLDYALPTIVKNNGAIEDFKDKTFRAVFDYQPEDALTAAISICEWFARAENEDHPRKLAIALTYGIVTMGVVGYKNRMSVISLSSMTSLTADLQEKAAGYSARILATGSLIDKIPNFETRYNSRFLGIIHLKGSGVEERLYDVFDGDEVTVRNLKRKTKTMFERGVSLYLARNFTEARGCFIEVLKMDRSDKAARRYLFLCDTNYNLEGTEKSQVTVYLDETED